MPRSATTQQKSSLVKRGSGRQRGKRGRVSIVDMLPPSTTSRVIAQFPLARTAKVIAAGIANAAIASASKRVGARSKGTRGQ